VPVEKDGGLGLRALVGKLEVWRDSLCVCSHCKYGRVTYMPAFWLLTFK
jgi:hypothetical protein